MPDITVKVSLKDFILKSIIEIKNTKKEYMEECFECLDDCDESHFTNLCDGKIMAFEAILKLLN